MMDRLRLLLVAASCLASLARGGFVQDAIHAAGPGGVAEIPPGIYHEAVVIPDGTFLVATDPTNTVLDGGGADAVVDLGRDAGLIGLTLQNGKVGVRNRGRFVGVFECTITGFKEYGIQIEGGSAALLHNAVIGDRQAAGIGCLGSNPYVACNLIESNRVGLLATMNFIPVVEYNIFRNNDLGIQAQENASVLLAGNIFDGNGQTIAGGVLSTSDVVRAATPEELVRLRGGKVAAYRELMKRVREEASALQPRILYDLTETPGRFGLICTFPWSVFTISSITRDTRIEAYGAFDAETSRDMNARYELVSGHPSVAVANPELTDKVNDRYVSEKIFIHPPSLAYEPDGSYVFRRHTNLGRIEVWAPYGFAVVSANPEATVSTERGRQVVRLLANGLTSVHVVMRRGSP